MPQLKSICYKHPNCITLNLQHSHTHVNCLARNTNILGRHDLKRSSHACTNPWHIQKSQSLRAEEMLNQQKFTQWCPHTSSPLGISCLALCPETQTYLSPSLFVTQEASLCQAQLHPLWCCFTGQNHLVHNYWKVMNFNKPYFSNASTF